jgi:DNA-binding XRE family transcriptional regulator
MKHKLRVVLERFGHTQNDLAELLGITYQSVSIKMNGKKDFSQTEIYRIIQYYSLTAEEVMDIFFDTKDRYINEEEESA